MIIYTYIKDHGWLQYNVRGMGLQSLWVEVGGAAKIVASSFFIACYHKSGNFFICMCGWQI